MSAEDEVDRLEELVRHTEGPQHLRKLFHAVSGVSIASALHFSELEKWTAVTVVAVILSVFVVIDVVRLRSRGLNEVYFETFAALVSPREAAGFASGTWYTLGVLIVVALFPLEDAISGILVLGLADPAGSVIGRRWGTTPLLGGTVLGSVSFFVVALAILTARHDPLIAIAVAAVSTVAERRSWPLDDNLTVPVVCSGLLAASALIS